MSSHEPRPISPLDLPLVRRLLGERLPLDMCTALTRGVPGMEEALLSSLPLADLGAPTLVLHRAEEHYIGQFRLRADRNSAQLTFLAPNPSGGDIQHWAALLEGIAYEAGKRGVHLLNAEVDQDHPIFRAFRLAGFAVYSRQVILRRAPAPVLDGDTHLLRYATDRDTIAISALQSNTVPRLLQQAEEPQPSPESRGLIHEQDGQIAAYLALTEGKSGIVIKPYFHPEAYDRSSAIIQSALTLMPRAGEIPVYFYARAYQDWLRSVLAEVEFEPWAHQALMVKYTVVRAGLPARVRPELDASRLAPPVVDGPMPMLRKLMSLRRLRRQAGSPPLKRNNGKYT